MELSKEIDKEMLKYMLKFAVVGAVGFGIGACIGNYIGMFDFALSGYNKGYMPPLEYVISLGLGGFILGYMFRDFKTAVKILFMMALCTLIAFIVTEFVLGLIGAGIKFAYGLVGGFVMGLFLMRKRKSVILLILMGLLANIIGLAITGYVCYTIEAPCPYDAHVNARCGAIVCPYTEVPYQMVVFGLIIGLTSGYLKYKAVMKNEQNV